MINPVLAEWLSFIFFGIAGVMHVGFFVLESLVFQKPSGRKIFGISEKAYPEVKIWAFNQGFYNLFLAIGIFIGLYLVMQKQIALAGLLISFCGFSMIGAGLVLFFSAPQLRRGACLQMLFPILGFFFLAFHIASHM
jgi:putative membrane protein